MSLFDYRALWRCLDDIGLPGWRNVLEPLLRERLCDDAHGDFPRWRAALEALSLKHNSYEAKRRYLMALAPWRKGPFELDGVTVDAEWRSNLKWDRLQGVIAPLDGRNVLDVGCGNGYYALRMREAGARAVIGIDPTILYVLQFLAVQHFQCVPDIFVLPLRMNELPANARRFDTTFSMGVLYHQRSPLDHLRELKGTLRQGGQLVLETIFVPGEESFACTPADRYARMRNVWLLPTIAELTTWLARTGFTNIEIADQALTTTEEQRSTEWMTFESLAEALDPEKPGWTVEGWPAPRRVIALAKAP
jgi:tRNA (mo5U34)-methyltransferase